VAANRLAPRAVRAVLPAAPLVSVVAIALVCASIIGQNAAAVRAAGPRLVAAVATLHALGFGLGYGAARLLGHGPSVARTISIEVGMQNSGLGVVLAQRHFPAEPLAAVPGAISAVVHSLLGSCLAAWWRRGGPAPPVSGPAAASSPSAPA
jgi:BASS family bile acid:Na+ symporter